MNAPDDQTTGIGTVGIAEHLNTATRTQLHKLTLYGFSQSDTVSAAKARLFGAPLAASFRDSSTAINSLGGNITSTHVVILALVLASAAASFMTQLLLRANATSTPTGTAATIQRLMTWGVPLGVLASGLVFNFPLGVLLYWFTSNLWTLAQQAYIIKFRPHTPPPRTGKTPSEPHGDDPTSRGQVTRGRANPRHTPRVGQRPDRSRSTNTAKRRKARKR